MDINSLLSPQESPRATPNPPMKGSTKKLRKPRTSKNASTNQATTSVPTPATTPYSSTTHAAQKTATSPVTSSPASGVRSSATSTPTIDGTQVYRQPSTAGMDTLADLASMQHHQQTARENAGGLRSADIYESQSPASNALPNIQNMTRAEVASRLRAGSYDVAMSEAVQQTYQPRTYSSKALSNEELEVVTQAGNYLVQNPAAYETLVRFINLLHRGLLNHIRIQSSSKTSGNPHSYELLQDLQGARESMSLLYALGEDLWADWIQDQILLAAIFEDKLGVRELCEKAVREEPSSSKVWLIYGQWMLSEHHRLNISDERTEGVRSAQGQPSAEEERILATETFSWQQVLAVWQRGMQETLWRMNDSHQLWDTYTELLLQDMGRSPSPEAVSNMHHWFLNRLQIPHAAWDQTSQKFSTFTSTFDNTNWELTMVTANRVGAEAKHKYEIRDFREISVLRASQKGDQEAEEHAFNEYIEYELNLNRRKNAYSFDIANALFQRAILRFPARSELWERYIMFLNEEAVQHGKHDISVLPLLENATRHCPWSGTLWAQYLLAAEISNLPFTSIGEIKHRATSTGILDLVDMDEMLKVTTAWCGFLRRRAFMPGSTDEELDVAEVGIRSAIEDLETIRRKKFGNDYKGDTEYRLEKIYIKYLTQAGNWDTARETFKKLIPRKGHDYDFWLRYYVWEMIVWSKSAYNDSSFEKGSKSRPTQATKVLQQAMRRTDLDWPEKIVQTYLHHCEDNEDAEQLQLANAEVWKLTKNIKRRREKEEYEQYQNHAEQQQNLQPPSQQDSITISSDQSNLGKRKRDDGINDISSKRTRPEEPLDTTFQSVEPNPLTTSLLKRDRENATVIVKNLPTASSETRVRQYFRDCGTINSLKLLREADGFSATALIEFESKEDVLTAQTKDMKVFDENPIEIQIGSGTTLYTCNFPPAADEAWIRDKFSQFGEIIDIRFPSLKYNTHRRFAYIQFRLPSQALAATQLNGEKLSNDIELVAKISDPAHKQSRHGAMYEGRELFISNLPWSADWKELKQLFSQYGSVESVRIPKKIDGSSKGIGFVVYRHKEDASKGLDLNMTSWKGRTISVVESTNDTAKRQTLTIAPNTQRTSASPATGLSSTNGEAHNTTSPTPFATNKKEEIQSRTLALLNVPDTVNDARVRALVEPYGKLVRIVLRPDHQGAIVEYMEQSSVGKASLALEGYDITPGRPLGVGTVDDMKQLKAEKRHDKIGGVPKKSTAALSPPPLVRRPGLGIRRRGGRGGLGVKSEGIESRRERATRDNYVNGDKVIEEHRKEGQGVKSKSNADFKALLNEGGVEP